MPRDKPLPPEKWKLSKKGNLYATINEKNVTIFRSTYGQSTMYRYVIDDEFSNESTKSIDDAVISVLKIIYPKE